MARSAGTGAQPTEIADHDVTPDEEMYTTEC